MVVKVRNQAEFDAAAACDEPVEIIEGYVEVRGSISVRASGSASVTAYGSASVRAYDTASVRAYDTASVRAWGSASVTASGSASVTAYDTASVTAYDTASVTAYDTASVRAWGSAFLRIFRNGASSIKGTFACGPGVIVAIHAGVKVRVRGGIIHRINAWKTPAQWCDYFGVEVRRGVAVLYKALNTDFTSPHGTSYAPGTKPEASDWDGGARECGGGLHFSPTPEMALQFHGAATRFVAVPVRLAEMAVHPDGRYPEKCKARRAAAPCYEVDRHGERIKRDARG